MISLGFSLHAASRVSCTDLSACHLVAARARTRETVREVQKAEKREEHKQSSEISVRVRVRVIYVERGSFDFSFAAPENFLSFSVPCFMREFSAVSALELCLFSVS